MPANEFLNTLIFCFTDLNQLIYISIQFVNFNSNNQDEKGLFYPVLLEHFRSKAKKPNWMNIEQINNMDFKLE